MKDKTIVLADSSYTIRRIVELSFSEIEDVEIISFENGQDLKNRLLEIKPRVVIVDVKLPGVSGYEICQLINQTEALKKTRIFLMKGSFEPVNQEWIKNLKFEEIITKPFDSNLLVAAVMKLLGEGAGQFPEGVPVSMPEDLAAIETGTSVEDELSFSDIRDEILSGGAAPKKPAIEEEDIQPSEEITQAQAQKDTLAPEAEESIGNPFESEASFGEGDIKVEKPAAKVTPEQPPKVEAAISSLEEELEMPDMPEPPGAETAKEETSGATKRLPLAEERSEPIEEGQFPGDLLEHDKMSIDLPAEEGAGAKEERKAAETTRSVKGKDLGDLAQIFSGKTRERLPEIESEIESHFFSEAEKELAGMKAGKGGKPAGAKAGVTAPSLPLDQNKIEAKLQEQLSVSIREVLWEIIPRLAEKIIREEIEKIKAEASKPEA